MHREPQHEHAPRPTVSELAGIASDVLDAVFMPDRGA
jgi:hypothetical protein